MTKPELKKNDIILYKGRELLVVTFFLQDQQLSMFKEFVDKEVMALCYNYHDTTKTTKIMEFDLNDIKIIEGRNFGELYY